MSDPLREHGSAYVRESHPNIAVNRQEKADGSNYGNSVGTDGMQGDLKQLGQQGSSLPTNFKNKFSESPYDKSDALPTEVSHDQERTQSPFKDDHCQGEVDELHGSCFHKSSFEYMAKTSHTKWGTEDSAHSQEHPMIVDDSQTEKMKGHSDLDKLNTAPYEEDIEVIFQEKSHWRDSDHKIRNYYSKRSPAERGRTEIPKPFTHSPGSNPNHSASTLTEKQMAVSLGRSPSTHQSPNGHEPLSSQKGIQELSYPPTSRRHRQSSSPARSSRHRHRQNLSPKRSDRGKEVPLQDHSSRSLEQTSASSPRSRHKDGSSLKRQSPSPKTHNSPQEYRRPDRSASRSPIRRRNTSSGYKRDHRGRSRSRSPYTRDHRRSPRQMRRYSPRQRSPPGYHSSHHSPRWKPWVPPPNRRTGLGKPGNNLFVAGFSFLTTERDLERKFSRFGRVRDVRIVRDKRSGDSRGFGFLSLERDEDADAAIRALDETEWNGRIILVEKSKSH